MKNLIKILIIFFILLGIDSCKKNDQPAKVQEVNQWVVITDTTTFDFHCFYYPLAIWLNDSTISCPNCCPLCDNNDSTYHLEYVINDSTSYLKLRTTLYAADCKPLPQIDFQTHTLLGKYTDAGGSKWPIITKAVYRNDSLKRILYQIDHIQINTDDIIIYHKSLLKN